MLRSKKVSIIAVLAILVSIVSLVSSVVALSATMDNGVSSVVNINNENISEPIFSVFLENSGQGSTSKESVVLHKELEITENTLVFGVTYLEKGGVLTIPFSIINKGDLDGTLVNISVLGLSGHFTTKVEGIEIGDKITKKGKIDVLFSLEYVTGEEELFLLKPEVYDTIQIVFDIQK